MPEVLLRKRLRYFLSQELLTEQAWSKATGTGDPVLGVDLLANAASATRMVHSHVVLAMECADFYHDGPESGGLSGLSIRPVTQPSYEPALLRLVRFGDFGVRKWDI